MFPRRRYESPARCAPQNVQKPFRGRGRAFSSLSLYLSLGAVSPLPKMRSSISGPMSTPPCIYEPVYACRGEKFRQGDFYAKIFMQKCFENQNARKSSQAAQQPPLFTARNCSGGGSPEGAEVQTCTLFSPLWALFGTFLSQQKVTFSPPQRRREWRMKSRLVLKSSMGKMLRKAHQSHSKSPRNTA